MPEEKRHIVNPELKDEELTYQCGSDHDYLMTMLVSIAHNLLWVDIIHSRWLNVDLIPLWY